VSCPKGRRGLSWCSCGSHRSEVGCRILAKSVFCFESRPSRFGGSPSCPRPSPPLSFDKSAYGATLDYRLLDGIPGHANFGYREQCPHRSV
jgi:hypothetical protein